MCIATAGEFITYAVLSPIIDMLAFMHGLLEIAVRNFTPDYAKFLESQLAVAAWSMKIFSGILAETRSNETLLTTFNDTLHTMAVESPNLFGNLSGRAGMSYIAKHAYLQLSNDSMLAERIGAEFFKALNTTSLLMAKIFEAM